MGKKKLVVVESPGKISKISHFLGTDYIVRACFGHIMDLPQKGLGIDVKNNFEPEYGVIPKKKDTVLDLKKVAKEVDEVYLCSDNDREGSFISESIRQVLDRKGLTFHRAIFNSITKTEIVNAINNPTVIDANLVEAQQARRLLDRLMGFKISPLLWRTGRDADKKSRSAGRVQSVGLLMIVDKQKEIDAFKSVKYWTVEATLSDGKNEFVVQFVPQKDKFDIDTSEKAEKLVKYLEEQEFIVNKVDKSQERKNPPVPFTTSTIQQVGSGALNWNSKRTMAAAQKLYEGGHCVCPGSLVTSGNGIVYKIEDFISQKISTISGVDSKGKKAILEVSNYSSKKAPEKLYKITTSKNHTLTMTGEHPLLRLDSQSGLEWVKSQAIKVGDYIGSQERVLAQGKSFTIFDLLKSLSLDRQEEVLVLLSDKIPKEMMKEWVQLEGLAESTCYKYRRNKTLTLKTYLNLRNKNINIDTFYRGITYRSSQSDPVFPNLYITPALTRWIGLVLGDGHIGSDRVTVSKPDITPELYSKYYGSSFGDFTVRQSNTTSMISKLFLEALGYGEGKKSTTLFIPEFITSLDEECVRGFIAGCWDSDGSIKRSVGVNSCKVSLSSASKGFIDSMRILLLRFGIVSSYTIEEQESINKRESIIKGRHLISRGDQHYLYINSGSWNNFYECVHPHLLNRLLQLEDVKLNMDKQITKRNKEQGVPINRYIETIRIINGITKQNLGKELEVDYWNYYGKVRTGRTRVAYFNKEQVGKVGTILSDKLLQELGVNDIYWESIKEIEIIDNTNQQCCSMVYDLTTSEHNFTCNGFITHNCTYMRTDSVIMAKEAVDEVRVLIPTISSPKYLPSTPNVYQNKSKNAQEAHECIRNTHNNDLATVLSGVVDPEEKKLLELIWRRAIASQMVPAIYDKVELIVKAGKASLKASGQTQQFDGYLKIWTHTDAKELSLPDLKVGQKLTKVKIESTEHETKPPSRYTNASLVKELESNGVGRPSTYASIIDTLIARLYVEMDGKAFVPTQKGIEVSDFLQLHFSDLININFTAQMENELDEVAEGKKTRTELLIKFYKTLSETIEIAQSKMSTNEVSAEACPICGSQLFVKLNRKDNQRFLACSSKECKKTFNMDKDEKPVDKQTEKLEVPCPECGGALLKKTSSKGTTFYGCENFKSKGCKITANDKGEIRIPPRDTGRKCKKCKKGNMLERKNKQTSEIFFGCSLFPKCRNVESGTK